MADPPMTRRSSLRIVAAIVGFIEVGHSVRSISLGRGRERLAALRSCSLGRLNRFCLQRI